MRNRLLTMSGLVGASVLGALVALSVAADGPKPPAEPPKPATVSPRYSVQTVMPGGIVIVDNQTNKLYIYQDGNKAFILKVTADLSETGKDKILQEFKN